MGVQASSQGACAKREWDLCTLSNSKKEGSHAKNNRGSSEGQVLEHTTSFMLTIACSFGTTGSHPYLLDKLLEQIISTILQLDD